MQQLSLKARGARALKMLVSEASVVLVSRGQCSFYGFNLERRTPLGKQRPDLLIEKTTEARLEAFSIVAQETDHGT